MGFEIVAGEADGFSGTTIAEDPFDTLPIDSARVIEVNGGAPRGREAGAVAIKIVQRKTRGFWPKSGLEFAGEPGFA